MNGGKRSGVWIKNHAKGKYSYLDSLISY